MTRELIVTLSLLITVYLCSSTSVKAASFNCAHAQSQKEKLICGNPNLSDLDDQLGRVYQQRRALLSPHGAELLQLSESSWLRFITVVCPFAASPRSKSPPENCFIGLYKERIEQLAKVGQQSGPFIFNRIDEFYAGLASDSNSGWKPGFFIEHVAYPQIDNLSSTQVVAWNEAVKALPSVSEGIERIKSSSNAENKDEKDNDTDINYEIGYANAKVISVQWVDSEYAHGAAHGIFSVHVDNKVLFPSLRRLSKDDLFEPDQARVEKLQDIFWTSLTKKGWNPAENQRETVESEIKDEVSEANHWFLTKGGIDVSFSANEGGCYACNPGTANATWADLRPLLSSKAIVP